MVQLYVHIEQKIFFHILHIINLQDNGGGWGYTHTHINISLRLTTGQIIVYKGKIYVFHSARLALKFDFFLWEAGN